MTLEMTSTAFREGETIPKEYTADGKNASPPLAWRDLPAGTGSFALTCEDPDAPSGTFTHWVVFNLPADSRELAEGVPQDGTLPSGIVQGKNDFGTLGYGGPSPPPGKPHHYKFKLYALDQPLGLQPGATRKEILSAMKGHIQGETELMGTYGR